MLRPTVIKPGLSAPLAVVVVAALGCTRATIKPEKPPAGTVHAVDHVVVHKAERRLLLMHGDAIVRSYHVSLGLNPTGRKERAGDARTPEGTYRLESHNAHSAYFLSMKLSYPNGADLARAHAHHWEAGSQIMVHGLPNELKHASRYYENHDWTDGCIALSNADMAELWRLTPDNVRIDILP
jgi:murein L,D-transpeptidase YafK